MHDYQGHSGQRDDGFATLQVNFGELKGILRKLLPTRKW